MSLIVELPRTWVAGLERRLATATSQTQSPFTGTMEVQDWAGNGGNMILRLPHSQGLWRVLSRLLSRPLALVGACSFLPIRRS